MKLIKGQNVYRVPDPIGWVESVIIDTGQRTMDGIRFILCRVEPDKIFEMMKDKISSIPYAFAHLSDDIIIYPTPDIDGDLIVRFYPPMKEI